MRDGPARGMRDLVMCEEVVALRHGGKAARLRESGNYTAIRLLRTRYLSERHVPWRITP
jgi:hypothetical protein